MKDPNLRGASMFMTSPNFEVSVPKSLLPAGGSCLHAVSLSSGADWFVLTTLHPVEESRMQQTTLVAWSTTLRTLLQSLGDACVVALHWMRPAASSRGWTLTSITEVWLAAESELHTTGALLFRVASEDYLMDELGKPASQVAGGRMRLIAVRGGPAAAAS
jgi:hypothetical protein